VAGPAQLIFWGLVASPYQLKMQALADYCGLDWRRWPDQASLRQALASALKLARGRRRQSIERYPQRVAGMDEYPAVPYYSLDGKRFYYDSTGLARHLDDTGAAPSPLIPTEPTLGFACRLVDEAFDEFGLYMVHHNRWVTSATTNVMGEMTSRELRKLVPPGMRAQLAGRLARRQARRCPYLFSVSPEGYDIDAPDRPVPPPREGFPPTHQLLDTAWRRYLEAIEYLLEAQPYLLGHRFTLADASAYGQLGMNLVDGRAAQLLEELAPRTYQWLCAIRDGAHSKSEGELLLSDRLLPLLEVIGETFVPLMQQNERAFSRLESAGQSLFNEAAFDRGEALYDGELLGYPFRAVAKTFQVVTWRELCDAWRGLPIAARGELAAHFPVLRDEAFSAADSGEPPPAAQ
jgi:glutathione S-transferase